MSGPRYKEPNLEEGEIRAAGNGPTTGPSSPPYSPPYSPPSSPPRPGSDEWIKAKAAEMRARVNRVDRGTDPDPYMDDYYYDAYERPDYYRPYSPPPEEDPVIKKFIEKIKAQTVLIHQPDTGIIEPKYQGTAPIQTYTPPVIPATSFTNPESREKVLKIFKERVAILIEAQGQQKLNTVVGDYIRE